MMIPCAAALLACGDGSGPGDRVFPAGTYEIALPYNGSTSWTAAIPATFTTAAPTCGQYVGGTITIAANGDASARRLFRQGETTYEEALTGTSRFQDGVRGFLIDYGTVSEHAHAEEEGSTTALYVGHVFPTRGDCTRATAAVRYVRRQ